jgi:hypothetical protein
MVTRRSQARNVPMSTTERYPPQTANECFTEAERALRSYFGVGGWVRDELPLAGFARSWSRKAT